MRWMYSRLRGTEPWRVFVKEQKEVLKLSDGVSLVRLLQVLNAVETYLTR